MKTNRIAFGILTAIALCCVALQSARFNSAAGADDKGLPKADNPTASSYMPVVETESFDTVRKRMEGEKATIEKRQQDLLKERYDLSNKPAKEVKMSRGKSVQEGVRAKLPSGVASWEALGEMKPDDIKKKAQF